MSSEREATGPQSDEPSRPGPRHMRLPGFLIDEDIGAGEVIKLATSAVGIRPCGGCAQRAAALDRWITFTSRRP
jgi:hypothetical protein